VTFVAGLALESSHRMVPDAFRGGISAVSVLLTGIGGGPTLAVVGIGVLGPVRVEDREALGPRDRVVLAALALRRGEPVSAEHLADALWGERPPASWAKVVQGCVVRLRKVLGASAIVTEPEGYRLVLPVDELDAQRFEHLVQRGRELLTLGEPERAAHVVTEGLALWRGPALAELDGWSPGRIEAARLDELRLDAQELLVDAALRAGRYRDVLAEARARVEEAPLREQRWGLLARAQYQAGRQGEALRTLHQARTVLATDLGVDPGPDLVALEAAILRQDPLLVAEVALPEPSATCPYLGLVPYDVADADGFFGRHRDVAACLRRLADVGVLAVVGPSGSGKSSLVRAGVTASLQRDGRKVTVVTPGAHPMDALTVLPATGPAPVLVVDQCEEAVVLCEDPGERARFFAALAAHAERAPLLVALRADRLGELSTDPVFARLIEPSVYLLSAMGETDLRAAIEGPADQAGLLLEPGLVELLMQDVEGEPGALPLLSHALRTTWERREERTLTVEGYRATGGIRSAVAQSAEALYEQVPADQRPLVRDLFLRLVAPGPDGQPVRSRVPRRTVATDTAHDELIELLVGARLVTSDDGVIQLAHEALARAWPRLQGWLDEDVEGQRILRHLSGAADTWDAMSRPDSELYRGARLAHALEWRERSTPDLAPTERAFLDASQALADTEQHVAENRARHQARQNRRLRALLTATAIFLVGALITGFVAVGQRDRAQEAGRVAIARELAAAANANVDVDPERSILLALEAVERTRSGEGAALPEAEEALHRAVSASRIELRVPGVGGRLDWSPDGTRFAAEGPEGSGTVDIRDARTGELLRSVPGHDGDVNDVAFNHDGSLLATTGSDGAARIWTTATGEQLHSVEVPDYPEAFGVWGPSFSPDGSLFAATWPIAGIVKILDLGTGQVRELRPVTGPWSTSFDPSGARIAVSSVFDPLAVVLDTGSGEPLLTLRGHDSRLLDVAWSPDGTSIATASLDGTARVFDGGTGAHRVVLHGHGGGLFGLDWSPDGSRLVTASGDGTANVWQVTEGRARQMITLTAQDMRKGVTGVAFSSDGTRVMTGDLASAATTIWDVSLYGDAEVANLPAVSASAAAVAFASDDRLVATGAHGSVTLWDAHDFTRVRTLGGPPGSPPPAALGSSPFPPVTSLGEAFSIDVSRDGRLVAVARFDGTLRVWDVETGEDAFTVRAGPTFPRQLWMDVTWNHAGDLLAIATNDGTTGRVTIVNRAGREVAVLQEDYGIAVGAVAFSPDGEQLITTRLPTVKSEPDDGQVVIWDWEASEVERAIDTPARHVVLSPTGDLIANDAPTQASYLGDTVHVWDAASGRRVSTLTGHSGGVLDLEFSPDGSRLATASFDGTVWLWDARSGEPIEVLRGHDGTVSSVAFSPDGSRLASVGTEGVVRVWALDLDELVEIAEREVTRSLTNDECRQFLHQQRCE
jgi:WD40 repeat protein/DNA-binding SARP family transcriptional activator